MARKKEQTIIHPLAAIEALSGYHNDIGFLMVAVQTAIGMMEDTSLDARKVCASVAPTLQEGFDRVQRWYTQT